MAVGFSPEGKGTYSLRGGELKVLALRVPGSSAFNLNGVGIGLGGAGSFVQSGGTFSVNFGLGLGSSPGATGTYELSGSGSLKSGPQTIGGDGGDGKFTQTGG